MKTILGLNFFHANAAAAIFVDGKLVAAAEEERFNRVKFSAGIPLCAIGFCLKQAGLEFKDVDVITYPRATNTRIVNNDQIHFQDRIYKINSLYDRYRINLKLINFKETLAEHFGIPVETLVFKLREEDHHLSHMLSGYFYSPFEQALIVSCDAFGDFVSVKTGVGRGNQIEILGQVEFPHSVGLFYTMVTQFMGFSGYGDESKVMGLSTFGYPEYTDRLRTIISAENGKLKLNLKYFNTEHGVGTSWAESTPDISRLYNENLTRLMGPQRQPDEEITSRHQNIATSVQHLTEEILFSVIDDMYARHQIPNLVLTGGLAYNSLLNARIPDETAIERIYVPPSPGNSGLCIGSALALLGDQASRVEMNHAFWGPEYSSEQIERLINGRGISYQKLDDPVEKAVELLTSGKALGWFQGRMEFGPRSLGSRCIFVNPLTPDPRRIKRRHNLKPLGISILEDQASAYIHGVQHSPFMSFMGRLRGRHRREFENVILNNYCRYQTVGPENPLLHKVLVRFQEAAGLPFLINTSLNVEGEPVTESPEVLLKQFDTMNLDAAILDNILLLRETRS
ncbi:MAG: carbamoyltransferase [Acidobacteriota bacterium]